MVGSGCANVDRHLVVLHRAPYGDLLCEKLLGAQARASSRAICEALRCRGSPYRNSAPTSMWSLNLTEDDLLEELTSQALRTGVFYHGTESRRDDGRVGPKPETLNPEP